MSLFGKKSSKDFLEITPDRAPDLTKQEASALLNVWHGRGSAFEQRLALQVIMTKFAMTYHGSPFIGDTNGQYFMSGRKYVGTLLEQAIGLNYANRITPEEDTTE